MQLKVSYENSFFIMYYQTQQEEIFKTTWISIIIIIITVILIVIVIIIRVISVIITIIWIRVNIKDKAFQQWAIIIIAKLIKRRYQSGRLIVQDNFILLLLKIFFIDFDEKDGYTSLKVFHFN